MLSLYEILKASKTGIAPDMWTALAGANFGGAGSGAETKEITGIPPLSIRSNGTMLLDYLISGNMSQTGTPTPDNPVMPQETGERTGNVLDYTTVENTSTATATQISGGISVSGRYYVQFKTVKFTVGSSYTMSWTAKTVGGTVTTMWRFRYSDNTYSLMPSSGGSLVAEKEVTALLLYVNTSSTASGVAELTNIMLNSGSTPLPYEPYGYKIPISSANTTTPIYLGEVETTRNIIKYEFTGEENWIRESGNTYALEGVEQTATDYANALCTHYVLAKSYSTLTSIDGTFSVSKRPALFIHDENFTTAAQLKTYLATQYANGTPVVIYYTLNTPQTAVVNEPLRKIGDYSDTVSYEQAGVQIPTNNGNTVIDVETTLKPSEMYIKYQE